MGEAKRRGTYEQRCAEGRVKREREIAERKARFEEWRKSHPNSKKSMEFAMMAAAMAGGLEVP